MGRIQGGSKIKSVVSARLFRHGGCLRFRAAFSARLSISPSSATCCASLWFGPVLLRLDGDVFKIMASQFWLRLSGGRRSQAGTHKSEATDTIGPAMGTRPQMDVSCMEMDFIWWSELPSHGFQKRRWAGPVPAL